MRAVEGGGLGVWLVLVSALLYSVLGAPGAGVDRLELGGVRRGRLHGEGRPRLGQEPAGGHGLERAPKNAPRRGRPGSNRPPGDLWSHRAGEA